MNSALTTADRDVLVDLAPVLRRAVSLDPGTLARFRLHGSRATVLARLPFDVLVARTVEAPSRPGRVDVVLEAQAALDWVDGVGDLPPARDVEWRSGLPPEAGWTRIETVPDDVVRSLVRSGALALQDAAAREGVPGAQPRAEVADALLDSIVLIVDDAAGTRAEVSLRALSALTRMGFLRRGGSVRVDGRGRWTRVVGEFGTVYLERSDGLRLS